MFNGSKLFNGLCGRLDNGCCRLAMNGEVAVKTNGGYKTYNLKTNRLTNCDQFVFDIADDFFFVMPTNEVKPGDIILVSGKPKCVITADKTTIKVLDYEDGSIKEILPERHIFMGSTYFYGKVFSMFGNGINPLKGKTGLNKIASFMMMRSLMGENAGNGGMAAMIPFMMMGGASNPFEDMFNFGLNVGDDEDEDIPAEEVKEGGEN